MYTGKRQDPETGLVYMGARYYNPALGRFLSIDPIEPDENNLHSLNRYAYANNNPYKFTDPDGQAAERQHQAKLERLVVDESFRLLEKRKLRLLVSIH